MTQSSHAVIAAAYLAISAFLLRFHARRKARLLFPRSCHDVSAMLFFCALMHADEVLAFYWPNPRLFAGVEVAAALFATMAAWRLPRLVQVLARKVRSVHESDTLRAASRPETRACAVAADRELAERYERLKNRITLMEDTVRRNTWLQQSQAAMRDLNGLLSELETVADERAMM